VQRCCWAAGVAALLCVWAAGCAAGSREDEETSAERGLAAAETVFFDAMQRGDVEAMMTVYTEDAISLPPGGAMVRGKAAIREFWARYLAETSRVVVERERVALEIEGDSLWEVSTYRQRVEWKDGSVSEDEGKWLTVRKRQADGSWKTHMGAWSSDRPASNPLRTLETATSR
jgi:uncharacterized protein (TIGR02246 family)